MVKSSASQIAFLLRLRYYYAAVRQIVRQSEFSVFRVLHVMCDFEMYDFERGAGPATLPLNRDGWAA
jgi:hypothetical protein